MRERKFFHRHRSLLRVAGQTRREQVPDVVASSTRERCLVVTAQRLLLTTISASTTKCFHECQPFLRGMVTAVSTSTSAPSGTAFTRAGRMSLFPSACCRVDPSAKGSIRGVSASRASACICVSAEPTPVGFWGVTSTAAFRTAMGLSANGSRPFPFSTNSITAGTTPVDAGGIPKSLAASGADWRTDKTPPDSLRAATQCFPPHSVIVADRYPK